VKGLTVFDLRLRTLFHFYGRRLRKHPVQELFAATGIAVGVALVFAVQVANTSITGSADQIVDGIVGSAKLQLAARAEDGFDERIAARVQRLPGVEKIAPLWRTRVTAVGPSGSRSMELLGVSPQLSKFGGELTRNFGRRGLRLSSSVGLPTRVADAIGVQSGESATLLINGRRLRVPVGAVLGADTIGPLVSSQAALAPLRFAQRISGKEHRFSQLLVGARPGQEEQVRRELEQIAHNRITVAPADAELRSLRQAAAPNDRSTSLFAAISAMVGCLFAFNAVLITAAERRRFIADLRIQGFTPKQVITILLFEALLLGLGASLIGLVLGDLLSRVMFDRVPEYLAFAFPVGTQRVVEPLTVGVALAGGLVAALLASLRPLMDLRRQLPIDAVFRERGEPGEMITSRAARVLLGCGLLLIAVTTVVVALAPDATVVGGLALALATLLVIPAIFTALGRGVSSLSRRTHHFNMLAVAMMEVQSTRTRSMALAAICALAVYGSVAIGGAHTDLLRGLNHHTVENLSTADLWVTTGGNDLTTDDFARTPRTRAIGAVPGVVAVREYRSTLLDVGDRRLWVVGRPRADRIMIPASQVLHGRLGQVTRRLRSGGWATISDTWAERRRLQVGDAFVLPTPSGPARLRVAAITTNLGWPPGSIVVNDRDYRRAWRTADPTALEIDLAAGVTPEQGKRSVQRALGPVSGLRVQTRAERETQFFELGRQGLIRLSQISVLLLLAAALAVASVLAATIWQRRARLAALKVQGFDHWQLWRALLLETGFLVGVGCAVGAVFGIYGHFLAGRYLKLATGFPAPFSLGVEQVLIVASLVGGIACLISALPGYAAAQTPMRVSMQE
jgi:putative ABC transport system permease protein